MRGIEPPCLSRTGEARLNHHQYMVFLHLGTSLTEPVVPTMFSLEQKDHGITPKAEKIPLLVLLLHERGREAAQKIYRADRSGKGPGNVPYP